MIGMPGRSHRGPLPPLTDDERALETEVRADLAVLAGEIGERNLTRRPEALARAADWLESRLVDAGLAVERQTYGVSGHPATNLIARLAGTAASANAPAGPTLVVGAHYDTAPGSPGADDNGTGCVALLALARRLVHTPTAGPIELVLFTNEEPPYFKTEQMGSLVHARSLIERGQQVSGMLSLEMLGYFQDARGTQQYPFPLSLIYPKRGDFVGFVGDRASRALVRRAIKSFRKHARFPSEGASLPAAIPGVDFSDHWSYRQVGIPAAMVTDTAFFRNPHYHTPGDTLDTIDYPRLARVTAGLLPVLLDLAQA